MRLHKRFCKLLAKLYAEVAELVDAHDSGSCLSNGVEVRVFSSAPVIARVSECSHDWNTLKLDCYNTVTTKTIQKVPK